MKRSCLFIALLLFLFSVCGCADKAVENGGEHAETEVRGGVLLGEGTVTKIAVSSLPEGYSYSYAGADEVARITEYFKKLPLTADFPENPNEYAGMSWVVALTYSDGTVQTLYHSGNMFVKADGGPWYKMEYDDAAAFGALLGELNG